MTAPAWAVRAADESVSTTLSAAPTLGTGRLVAIDGPAGSGKTTLAEAVFLQATTGGGAARVVHLDDLYPGWGGLREGVRRLEEQLLRPHASGSAGRFRRWDWIAGREADWVVVPPVDLLVVEGCGSGASSYADLLTTLVWVEVPRTTRLARGLARDGEGLRDRWTAWMSDEAGLFADERTRERADLIVTGSN